MIVAVPALTLSELTVTSDGQVIDSVSDPELCTVTEKLQLSPVGAVHDTVVVPTGKTEPDGGLQTTPLPPSSGFPPQAPDVVGAA